MHVPSSSWRRGRPAIDQAGNVLRRFADSHRTELLIATLVFVVEFSETLPTPMSSNGGVETWLNLTNQMFYGTQDFLFSYGPLYWLVGGVALPFDRMSYWLSVATLSLMSASFWSLVVTLCYRSRALLLFGLAFLLFFESLKFPALQFLWPFAVVAYLEYRHDRPIVLSWPAVLSIGVLVGAAFYVRYLYGLVGLITIAPYFLSRIAVTRRPWELLATLGGVLLGYVATGLAIFHSSSSLLDYLAINSQLSFGNSVDMALGVISRRATYLTIAVIAVLIAGATLLSRRTLFLSVAALLALLIKLGFSRADHYIQYFVLPTAALSLLLLFSAARAGQVAFVIVSGLLIHLSSTPIFPGAPTHHSFGRLIDLKADYETRMQALYQDFRLPDGVLQTIGRATIDVYPFQNEIMFANRLNYLHRPLFQNYMTLTPELDRRNQAFFEGAARPQFVLWAGRRACEADCNQFVDVDNKLALSEDPLTTSAILLNYHVVARSRTANGFPFMLLEQNPSRTPYTESVLGEAEMSFGRWYGVPGNAGGVTKLRPDFLFTTTGRLQNLLFRGEMMVVSYRLATGSVRQFPLNILNAASGIWVSPQLADFDLVGVGVEAIRIDTTSHHYVLPDFRARWVGVPIAAIRTLPTAAMPRPTYDVVLAKPPAADGVTDRICEGSIDGVDEQPAIPGSSGVTAVSGWLAVSPSQGLLPDRTFLTLTAPDGGQRFVTTHVQSRPDVAAHFGLTGMAAAGYAATIKSAELHGHYTLGLAGLSGSKLFTCRQFAVPLTIDN